MTRLVIEKDKILHNLERVKAASQGSELFAVLKANAYGFGLRQMALLLREHGVRRFAVTDPKDALLLRGWGLDEEEILVMRSTSCEQDIQDIITACATATIGSYDAAVALNGLAEKEGIMVDAHIKIDCGMGRYGFDPAEIDRVISIYRFMTNINITGMYTHLPNAFKKGKKTNAQAEQFQKVADKIRDAGLDPGMLHIANSCGLFYSKVPKLDAVRIGSALTGRISARGDFGLQKTGKLESTVAEVRWIPRGHGIGYGSSFITKKPTKIAVIPVGTYDGFMMCKEHDTYRFRDAVRYAGHALKSFLARRRYYVTVKNKRARILGHVGLGHTVVDVTEIDCAPGDRAVFDVAPMYVPQSVERNYV